MNLEKDKIYSARVKDYLGEYQTLAIFEGANYDQKRGIEILKFIYFMRKDDNEALVNEHNHSVIADVMMNPKGISGDVENIVIDKKEHCLFFQPIKRGSYAENHPLNYNSLLTKFREAQQKIK